MNTLAIRPGFPGDPFKRYGEDVSKFMMETIRDVPSEYRKIALEALLDELEPGLFATVTDRANTYKGGGLRTKEAVRAAIASSLSSTLANQVVDVARGKSPSIRSLAGLGTYDGSEVLALAGYRHALGLCGPKCWARKAKNAGKKVGGAVKKAGKKVGGAAKTAGKKVGGAAKSAAKKAYSWGKTVVKYAKKAHCKIAESKVSEIAAGAAAAYYGVPPQAGVAGHKAMTSAVCGSKASDAEAAAAAAAAEQALLAEQAAAHASSRSRLVLPIAVGGVAVVGFLLWRRRA